MKGFVKFLGTVITSVVISCLIVRWWLHSGLPVLRLQAVEVESEDGNASLYSDGFSVVSDKGTRIFMGILDGKPAYKHTENNSHIISTEDTSEEAPPKTTSF